MVYSASTQKSIGAHATIIKSTASVLATVHKRSRGDHLDAELWKMLTRTEMVVRS